LGAAVAMATTKVRTTNTLNDSILFFSGRGDKTEVEQRIESEKQVGDTDKTPVAAVYIEPLAPDKQTNKQGAYRGD
jgi:hypothetical protein